MHTDYFFLFAEGEQTNIIIYPCSSVSRYFIYPFYLLATEPHRITRTLIIKDRIYRIFGDFSPPASGFALRSTTQQVA